MRLYLEIGPLGGGGGANAIRLISIRGNLDKDLYVHRGEDDRREGGHWQAKERGLG